MTIKRKLLLVLLLITLFGLSFLSTPSYSSYPFPPGIKPPTSYVPEQKSTPATGDLWYSDWGYRMKCTITGASGAGTNYQVYFNVMNTTGDSISSTVCIGADSARGGSAAFGDVRFTASDGITLLDYWIETVYSGSAYFWVNVKDSLSSNAVVYIYYGKTGQTTTSNIANTFIFADDFESNNFNAWTSAGAYWSTESTTVAHGTYAAYGDSGSDTPSRILSKTIKLNYDLAVDCWIRFQTVTAGETYPITGYSNVVYPAYMLIQKTNDAGTYNGAAYVYYQLNTLAATTWQKVEIAWDRTNSLFKFRLNWGAPGTSLASKYGNGTIVNTFESITSVLGGTVNWDHWLDDFRIRKWQVTEPVPGTWGSQETYNPDPVNAAAPYCSNLDDTNNLYARYKVYTFETRVTDVDGYADIHYVELLASYNFNGTSTVWIARYHQPDNTWIEYYGGSNIDLDAASCSHTHPAVNELDVSFGLRIEWVHPDATLQLTQYVVDNELNDDSDSYTVNYDYETRLDFAMDPMLSDGVGLDNVGNYNTVGSIQAGTGVNNCYLGYEGFESTRHPPASEVDVWVTCPDTPDPDWQATNYAAAGGTWSAAVDSDDVVGLDTYTVKAVIDGAGSAVTDQCIHTHTIPYTADAIKIVWLITNSTYNELGHSALLTVGLQSAFDSGISIDAGTFSLKYGSTYLALTHLTDRNWTVADSSAVAASRTYNSVNGTDSYYGLSIFDMNGKSATCHWDVIVLTVTINRGWTVIGYNTTISVTGVYSGLGYKWNGTATFNSTWDAPFYPSESSAANWSFVVTSITNTDMSLIGFSANVVWCIWDTVIPTSTPLYVWVQSSASPFSSVWVIWGTATTWMWTVNSTTYLIQGANLVGYANSTELARGAIWNAVGGFGGLAIGPFNSLWYHASISANALVTINGQSYDWTVYGQTVAVVVTHTLHLVGPSVDVQDNWITFYYTTNAGNATLTIWDSMVSNTTPVGYCQWEGSYQIAKPTTIGGHHYTLLYNATHSGSSWVGNSFNNTFAYSDWWIWQNWTYTVNPIQLSFDDTTFDQSNSTVVVKGKVWTSSTTIFWTVYESTLGWASGSVTGVVSGEVISWKWTKSSSTSSSAFTVYISDGTYNCTFHGYYLVIAGNEWVTIYGGSTNREGDVYITNETIIYQNPVGWYMDQGTAAFFAFGVPVALFIAYLMHRVSLKKAVIKEIKRLQLK